MSATNIDTDFDNPIMISVIKGWKSSDAYEIPLIWN